MLESPLLNIMSSLLDETLNGGPWPMTVFRDKLLIRTYCDEAGDYAVPNMLSPRDLVFIPDLSDINWTIIIIYIYLPISDILPIHLPIPDIYQRQAVPQWDVFTEQQLVKCDNSLLLSGEDL